MPSSNKVSFRDIKTYIMSRIRDRTWPPGSLLPGEVELSEEFGCARATVNRAMRELADEGIVDRKRKAGTRVCTNPVRHAIFAIPLVRVEIEATGASYRYALVKREIPALPDWLRCRLGVAPSTRVLHLQCMHYADNAPFQFEERWININAVPEVENADFTHAGPNEWLLNTVLFTEAEISFSATAATKSNTKFLEIPIGEPVFTVERITWLENQPVTFAKMSFAAGYRLKTKI